MCGIVAVLSRPDGREVPAIAGLAEGIGRAGASIRAWGTADSGEGVDLLAAVEACETVVQDLRGFAGLNALIAPGALEEFGPTVERLGEGVARFEQLLDQRASSLDTREVERLNAVLIRVKDAHFTLARDRIANIERVRGLSGGSTRPGRLRAAYDLNVALNALDRLEVRGRDSAGIHLFVRGPFTALSPELTEQIIFRASIAHFTHQAVREATGPEGERVFSFVYKVAAEVGELGENVRALRAAISGDDLLWSLLDSDGASAEILGHTRWASVGVISEANAHPLNQEQGEPVEGPYAVAALNGDVDNYQQLIREEGLKVPPEITTDAKVIPVLFSTASATNGDATDAFRKVVARFEGSVAIGAANSRQPGELHLALRGSGQALYVGVAEGSYIVASEPYGIVEETSRYMRLDGETPADPDRPSSRGQVVVLRASGAGTTAGMSRFAYDGTELPVSDKDIKSVEITTRDIDRGDHAHFLRKEIAEAPDSIRKTLRGRVAKDDRGTHVILGEESLPAAVRERLANGTVRIIRVIGQGTAAVAGQGVSEAIRDALRGSGIQVDALPASEVSGFHLRDEMSDTLFVAISQSGTTTDTNRTVDLLRSRGAAVIGIVNRRHSDLTERVDGVLYTSDGRDVEMSVASTKAFYSQIAAGTLLGEALGQVCEAGDPERRTRILDALSDLPNQMRELLGQDAAIAEAAAKTAPPRRHWAIVGNGRNKIAAEEIRIKLSELCYKSIACDATEDKKHIDLSSEPLVLVCAAGLEGGNAADVGKEIEIYAAHKACPVVIATEGSDYWRAAAATIHVPDVDPELAYVLATMAGHLFGYHAAQAIDRLALPLREARGAIEVGALAPGAGGDLRDRLRPHLITPYRAFANRLKQGEYNGILEASTAARLSLLFRYATRAMPLEHFPEDFGRVGTPGAAIEELTTALTAGIEELARPIDAIKHQAKTVTVGISRGDEALLDVPLTRSILQAGVERTRVAYRDLKTLQALDLAIREVSGYTRYEIEGITNGARIHVVGRGGVAEQIPSRTDRNRQLRGTKNTVAMERRVLVAVGLSDHRPIVLMPELDMGVCAGIMLLHTEFRDDLDSATVRRVLQGYRNRYANIRDALVEQNGSFDDELLTRMPVLELLTQPVLVVAERLAALA